MASIQGNTVINNAGTQKTFSTNKDANAAYALLCDYEAFLIDWLAQCEATNNPDASQP